MPKTIFGTTEKSNFILNMKSKTLQKWLHAVLIFCIAAPQIGAMFIVGMQTTSVWMASFVYATGFTSILFYLIVMLKQDVKFKDNKSYLIMSLLFIFTVVSYYGVALNGSSEDLKTALFGETGRYEGLLTIIAYYGIFLVATCVSKKNAVRNIFDVLIGAGIIQSVIAILQHIPALDFPNDFRNIMFLMLQDCMLSSGLADSPIFYGSFLTLVSGIAVFGAVYEKNLIRSRIYGAALLLFAVTALFTSSIVPIIGIGAVLIIAVIIVLYNYGKGNSEYYTYGLLCSPELRLTVLVFLILGVFVLIYCTQGIFIRDKAIAYSDAYYRLFIVNGPSPVDTSSLYEIAWGRSIDFIKQHPITGVGPDRFAAVQFNEAYSINSIDRSYNEYLYTAVTRGIPSLLCYLALLGFAFKRLFAGIKQFIASNENWFRPALLTAVTAYSIQAFFSASAITVAPFFWLILGLSCSARLGDKPAAEITQNM